ncbi:MAG: hypothetical protein K0B09_04910 [Bacteroidales bacterium]|nr:hypothetical protein [Bacteroidales bacterium]
MTKNKDEITRELQELGLSRLASQMKEESGFGVPQGYFDGFSASVRQKIDASRQKEPATKARFFSLRAAVSMAATFLVLIGLGVSFLLLREGKEEGLFSDFDDQIFDEYFARATEFDRAMFYDLILDTEVADSKSAQAASQAEEDFFVEYLLDAAQYYGIEPTELIIQNGNDNRH